MKLAVDLHIHSALSPCSDNDMTPNNILNMALIKGLDIIAVTDHNSVENFEAVSKCARGKDILVVPGMEAETREEVHLICLFPDFKAALKIQEMVQNALPSIKNREDVFGQQIIMDEQDNIKRYKEQLLLTAANIGTQELYYSVRSLSGIVIPAHVDRNSYSIISNLGSVPEELNIKYLEVSKNCSLDAYIQKNPHLNRYSFLKASDAHTLADILERENFIEIKEKSIAALFYELGGGNSYTNRNSCIKI
ncbi:MAG: PHP domain-containing protein [Acetivibrionales bacterium]|jgi:PHP family Zn ribbon phosphoesterase